jgi:hypothetical protein
VATIIRAEGVGQPTEVLALRRADIQSVVDAIEYAVRQLQPADRYIVINYCWRQEVWETCKTCECSRWTLRRRLDAITAMVAQTLSGLSRGPWQAYMRLAEALTPY